METPGIGNTTFKIRIGDMRGVNILEPTRVMKFEHPIHSWHSEIATREIWGSAIIDGELYLNYLPLDEDLFNQLIKYLEPEHEKDTK